MLFVAYALLTAFPQLSPQLGPQLSPQPGGGPAPSSIENPVWLDQAGDGTVWVRGEDYKLRLSAAGARFTPRDPRTETPHHVALQPVEATIGGAQVPLDRIAEPVVAGRTVTYARGPIIEVWEFGPLGARQSFLLPAPVGVGDLVLRLGLRPGAMQPGLMQAEVQSDLTPSRDEDGVQFYGFNGARARYGAAVTLDADGRRFDHPSELGSNAIELRVPEHFLATARYPVLIDPLISSVNVDPGTDLRSNPDSAVDSSLGTVVYVCEDSFTPGDRDIIAKRFNDSGVFLGSHVIDISDDNTVDPAVANHNAANQFLIAWTRLKSGLFTPQKIRARTLSTSGLIGATLNLSFGQGEEATPDVGGPSSASPSADYYVVWSERGTFTGKNIRGRGVDPSGSLSNGSILDGRLGDQTHPAISQTSGPGATWMVAYQTSTGPGTTKIDGLTVLESGAPGIVFTDLTAEDPGNDSNPDVTGTGTEFLTVFQRRQPNGNFDIVGTRTSFGTGLIAHKTIHLSELEPGVILSQEQVAPAVAATKQGFVYTYQEAASSTTSAFDIRAAAIGTVFLGVSFFESHVLLSPGFPGFDGDVKMCAIESGHRTFPVWTRVNPNGDLDVFGAIYDEP